MKAYTATQVESLIAHLRDNKALCTHDIGGELPEVLEWLMEQRRMAFEIASLAPGKTVTIPCVFELLP